MKYGLTWGQKLFSSTCEIYSKSISNGFSGGDVVGKLVEKAFKNVTFADINGKSYAFQTKGIFNSTTNIVGDSDDKIYGRIEYSNNMKTAKIELNNKAYEWTYYKKRHNRWFIIEDENIIFQYRGTTNKGFVEYDKQDDLLALTGLFVHKYYTMKLIMFIMIMQICIFSSIFSMF